MAHAWEIWGRQDPYYGVLSDERFRTARISESREEFFATGEDFVKRALSIYESCFGTLSRGRALDFGCGVGRLTLPLAGLFEEAVGTDVAPSMLAEARANAAGVNGVCFVQSDHSLSALEGTFDFVLSYIVFQHIPRAEGMRLCRELLRRIRPGGGCSLHFSIKRRGSWMRRIAYWLRFNVPGANALLNLSSGRSPLQPATRMEEYSLSDLVELFADMGLAEISVITELHWGSTLGATLMARRSPA